MQHLQQLDIQDVLAKVRLWEVGESLLSPFKAKGKGWKHVRFF
jgi:hypothetical protein